MQIPYKEIVDYLNLKAAKGFKPSATATRDFIAARWHEGHRLADFQRVIDNKTTEWLNDPAMNPYLRPATLFCASKFEGYLHSEPIPPLARKLTRQEESLAELAAWAKGDTDGTGMDQVDDKQDAREVDSHELTRRPDGRYE